MNQLFDSYSILWQSNHLHLNIGNIYYYIPNRSSLLLLSDGSFTKILDSIINNVTHIQLTRDQKIYRHIKYLNNWYSAIGLTMYRQGWLQEKSGYKLIFASSWYKPEVLANCPFVDVTPLGKVFINSELILYRKLHCISCLCSKWFEKQFKFRGYIWSREYVLYHEKEPFIFIREFFSPKLTTNL
uniref:Chorismate lyase n=1 Tax=Hildenbrandia rubra TaxID=31481 RepID=A0A1C9CG07_9FLOR|nr:hypothetical protein Hrub_061 [Hildenbrandia rubra]AOM67305.1 hypothetical protein Hrub_061 [Hildenbrandia rubra]